MNWSEYTILIVEDDPYDTKLIKRAINKARILNPIQCVDDGSKAIAYLAGEAPFEDREKHPLPALMLLDLKLPKRNGFEVVSWVRDQPQIRRLPIIVFTSSKETLDVNRAYDLGANSYLVKPVGSTALVDLLKTVELYWLVNNTKPDLESN